MNDSRVKIEVHLIQNFAPSNLNRDDTGQPKSATFGGFRRARVSSQCGKRAVREWWRERSTVTVGVRTKRLQQILFNALQENQSFLKDGQDADFLKDGIRVFTDAYYANADKKKPEQTRVLIFIGPEEVQVCAEAIRGLWGDKETIGSITWVVQKRRQHHAKADNKKEDTQQAPKSEDSSESAEAAQGDEKKDKRPKLKPVDEIADKIKKAQVSADIALFGRMLAEQPGRNTDGACQVAHPISTHKVDMEMDFYTAVDDLNPAEETGAGMMGVVGFNSACYYRYALVDRDQLARNLARKTERKDGRWAADLKKDDYTEADKVIKAFLEAMVCAIPTGKQNSFAAQNLPSFGLFVRRQGGVPVSLANAFAKPVRPTRSDDDLVGMSVAALTKHWDAVKKVYGDQGVKTTACFHIEQEGRLNGLDESDKKSVVKAVEAVMKDPEGGREQ